MGSILAGGGLVEATQLSLTLIGVGLLVFVTVGFAKGARSFMRLRRRWRATVGRAGGYSPAMTAATSSTWWLAQHDRQRMWRSVTRAEQAVRAAANNGVPIGDLPSLTRQLRDTAESIDIGLAPGAVSGTAGRELHRQAREVARAGNEIAEAAGGSIAGESRPRTDRVVEAIRVELEAVRHGRQASTQR